MRKFIIGLSIAAAVSCSCLAYYRNTYLPKTTLQKIEQPEIIPVQAAQAETKNSTLETTVNAEDSYTITISSFNIQIFGKSKREKEEVMKVLTGIVQQYDIVAIQEVRDSMDETVPYFVSRLNGASGKTYGFVVSPRLGRTSSKEQYAFVYDTQTITYTGKSFVLDDANDIFEREPFIAQFRSGSLDFILVNIHTKPDNAKAEIMALEKVMKNADDYFSDDSDVIVLGDYNADGSYFTETTTTGFRSNTYHWVIDDAQDTTVAASSNTYDRIVFNKLFTHEDYAGSFGVFRFDKTFNLTANSAKLVSDHFPVWAIFYILIETLTKLLRDLAGRLLPD